VVVDFIGNCIQLHLTVPSQVGALGMVMADEAVHVLVGAPLPGAMWIAEVHGNTCGFGQLFMPWSYVMLWRIGTAMPKSLSVKASITLAALAGLGCGSLTNMSKPLVRSTSVPNALALALMRSPSQSLGN
jgi:hypothetical protein